MDTIECKIRVKMQHPLPRECCEGGIDIDTVLIDQSLERARNFLPLGAALLLAVFLDVSQQSILDQLLLGDFLGQQTRVGGAVSTTEEQAGRDRNCRPIQSAAGAKVKMPIDKVKFGKQWGLRGDERTVEAIGGEAIGGEAAHAPRTLSFGGRHGEIIMMTVSLGWREVWVEVVVVSERSRVNGLHRVTAAREARVFHRGSSLVV